MSSAPVIACEYDSVQRGRRATLFALTGLLATLLGGCSNNLCSCETYPCSRIVVDGRLALGPESFISWGGEDLQLLDLDVSDSYLPAVGTCVAKIEEAIAETYPERPMSEIGQHVLVACGSRGGSVKFYVGLGDVRFLEVGASWPPVRGWSNPSLLLASLTVEEAAGGAAAYPVVVTADFLRVLRLDFTTANPDQVTFEATLRFTLTAADFHAYPFSTCESCAC